jgi:hypothetical protein
MVSCHLEGLLGVQEQPAAAGDTDVVVPSPSGLRRMGFEGLVARYRALATFVG